MNLDITVKITLMLIGKTLKYITIKAQTKEKIEKVKAMALVETTQDSTKIENTKQYLITITTKNSTKNLLHLI